jgi:ABC-type phosphate transport system auxiliary subunit
MVYDKVYYDFLTNRRLYMDSIVNKLTEIEDAASAIVKHAEEQKEVLNREYDEKKRAFDHDLDEKTNARLNEIRSDLETKTSQILESQSGSSTELIRSLRKEYEEKHTEYAREILRRITEV